MREMIVMTTHNDLAVALDTITQWGGAAAAFISGGLLMRFGYFRFLFHNTNRYFLLVVGLLGIYLVVHAVILAATGQWKYPDQSWFDNVESAFICLVLPFFWPCASSYASTSADRSARGRLLSEIRRAKRHQTP